MHIDDQNDSRQGRVRLLAWEGCLNARDLGGYPTADGRETRWGAIVRSDNLTPLSEAARAAVADYGVRLIIDLRIPPEVNEYPNPFAEPGSHGITYAHLSFIDPAAPDFDFDSLYDDYTFMLNSFPHQVAAIMTAIARAPAGTVLIHCAAGKDRTGVISALLLVLAGVPREIVAQDYALSAECLRPREEAWIENGPGERSDRQRRIAQHYARPEVMHAVLGYLDERYGGIEPYLQRAGIRPEDLVRLRERLLTGDTGSP